MIPDMRTGLVGEVEDSEMDDTMRTVGALMRVFCKNSIDIASTYTFAKGRHVVKGEDMKKSLMYVARTFFQSEDLDKKVELERMEMEEEEKEEEEEEGDPNRSEW